MPTLPMHSRRLRLTVVTQLGVDLAAFADSHRAVFHLGYFGVGVQSLIGEFVGGGFVVAERDEHRASLDAMISAGEQADFATAGFNSQHITRFGAYRIQIQRVTANSRRGRY